MAKTKKAPATPAYTPPPVPEDGSPSLAALDAYGFVLCPGDKVFVETTATGSDRRYRQLAGQIVTLGESNRTANVQLPGELEPVRLNTHQLRWDGYLDRFTGTDEQPCVAGDRVRVLYQPSNYGEQDQALKGELGTVQRIDVNGPFPDLALVAFDNASLETSEFQVTDLVRVPKPAPVATEPPPIEQESELPFIEQQAAPVTPKQKLTFDHFNGMVHTAQAGLRVLSLASIVIIRNTRKVFDEAALAELAESIKAHGVLQPIVVRPAAEAGQYELVAGERRYRAALAAGLSEIPATVRTLTDREFLEVQLLENLQRVDVRPADEAQAFAELLQNGFALEEIAAKVGKPARFVAERARLMELLPEWVDALHQGRLLIGSAQQLARLTRAQQAEAHQQLDTYYGEKVDVAGVMRRVYSAADIRQHIARQFSTHDLEAAAFPKDDADLYPPAGTCVTCPKRTGNTPYLFEEMGGNTCLDGACFTEKATRYVARMAEQLAQDGRPVLKVADHWSRVPADVLNLNKYSSAETKSEAELVTLREAGRVRPALMTEGKRAGQIVEVVLDAAVAKQPDVVAAIKEQRQAETQKEKDEAAKVRALGAARRQAYFQLTADVHGPGEYVALLLRRMLYKTLEYRSYGSLRELLRKVYGWEGFKGGSYLDERERKQVVGHLAAMDVPQLQALLLDIQLLGWLEEEHPSTLPALCKELGWSDEQLLAAHAERKKGKKSEVPA